MAQRGTRLRFNLDDLKRLVAHAKAAKEHRPGYDQAPEPALFLVHDDGIYLMSSGIPRDLRDGQVEPNGRSFVAYAKGFNADTDTDVHERAAEAVGGDDFAEMLPLEGFTSALDDPTTVGLLLKVTSQRIEIIIEQR